MFLQFSSIFLQKNVPKTLPKRGLDPSKIDVETVLFFNIAFFRFWPRFWRVLGQLGPQLGSQLGAQIRASHSKNRFFSLSWANLGQLRPKRSPKRPQKSPKRPKMRPQSTPGRPKRPKMRPNSARHPKKPKWAKKAPQNLHITNPRLTRPSQTKPVTHQTGDPPFLILKGNDPQHETGDTPNW